MKRNLSLWQLVGFGFVSLAGTLLHFLYDWTDSTVAALFSSVNESTWEHMKLLYFPLLLFALIEWPFVSRRYKNFWRVKLGGTLCGLLLIPILFYTLRGAFGETPDFVNITIYFVATAAVFLSEIKRFREASCAYAGWAFAALLAIGAVFWIFTFQPPEIPLFADPIDGSYGLQAAHRLYQSLPQTTFYIP